MKRHNLVATLECVMNFQKAYRNSGTFEGSMPIEKSDKWPEVGDRIAIKTIGHNIVLVAFLRTLEPGEKSPNGVTSRLNFTAGVPVKPFGHALSKV
jgi:hypothetical protein